MAAQTTQSFATSITDFFNDTGANKTLRIYDKYVKADISSMVTNQDPNRAPFLRLMELLGTKEPAMNHKFEWLEERLKSMKTTIAGGSGVIGSAVSTDLQTAGSSLYIANDLLKVVKLSTGVTEIMKVVSVTNATTYVVARGQSGTSAIATLLAADEVIKIGNVFGENTAPSDSDSVEPNWFYNLTQTFKSAVEISGRMEAQNFMHGGSELQKQLQLRMQAHSESIEAAGLWGSRAWATAGNTTTGGFEYFVTNNGQLTDSSLGLSGNIFDATSFSFTEAYFDKIADYIFRYGSDRKYVLTSGKAISKLNTFAKDYLKINDKLSATLGLEVSEYKSFHGTLAFIHHRMFDESTFYNQQMYVIDPAFVKKRFLNGRDTFLEMNVQTNGTDGKKHQILSDVGFEFRNTNFAHFIIKNLSLTISG